MHIVHFTQVKEEKVDDPQAKGASIRWAIDGKLGAPTFAMRVFDIEPGGYTPYHEHWNEQEMFVLEGKGTIVGASGSQEIGQGMVIYVEPYEAHKIENTGNSVLRFICCIPLHKPE